MELKSKRDRLQVGLLLLPGLLVFALFTIYPIVKLLHMSFLPVSYTNLTLPTTPYV